MEVQSISRATIDEAVFVIPSDYQAIELPALPTEPPPQPAAKGTNG